jgi:hypothetical protein
MMKIVDCGMGSLWVQNEGNGIAFASVPENNQFKRLLQF